MTAHSQNIGPLSKSKLNNLVKISLETENISKSLLTESVSVLNKDEPNSSSGKSELDVADEEEPVIDTNEHITEGELWHELEKELEKHNMLNILTQVEEADTENEIIEEEDQLVNASNSTSTSGLVDSCCLYPPGKIMHIVSAPSDESSSNSKEEHIKLYETPRQLYSKFRLSKKMINDHYMPTYRTMIQLLIQQLKKDGVK
ncbi:hypothetical protein V8G54_015768 [Vigna mungo]|uniref:Uncharacterized protein n=1 Tax=Vigna mungo TaxID=3915 RepID=A0AAQ3RZT7_VIGMU